MIETNWKIYVVGMAIVPSYELGSRQTLLHIGARHSQRKPPRSSVRQYHGIVSTAKSVQGNVPSNLDVSNKRKQRIAGYAFKNPHDLLDMLMIWRGRRT